MQGGNVIVNETGADINFRVEGSGDANLFKCDAGDDAVNIAGASSKVGFYGATPVTKTAVADIGSATINAVATAAGGSIPLDGVAADQATTQAAVAALESKLNALLDALQALGLV